MGEKEIYDKGTNALLIEIGDNINRRVDDIVKIVQDNKKEGLDNDKEVFDKIDRLTRIQSQQALTLSELIKDISNLASSVKDIADKQNKCTFNTGEFHQDYNKDLRYLNFINKCFSSLSNSLFTLVVTFLIFKIVMSIPIENFFNVIGKILGL